MSPTNSLEIPCDQENVPPDDRIFGSRKKRIEDRITAPNIIEVRNLLHRESLWDHHLGTQAVAKWVSLGGEAQATESEDR